jgi:hypothetical protein
VPSDNYNDNDADDNDTPLNRDEYDDDLNGDYGARLNGESDDEDDDRDHHNDGYNTGYNGGVRNDGFNYANVGRAPICASCGVTALPAHRSNVIDSHFVCDNDGCDAFGEAI